MSAKSKNKAIAAINAMLTYWYQQGYLAHNPLSLIKLKDVITKSHPQAVVQRAFTNIEWTLIMQALAQRGEQTSGERKDKARLHFLLMTLVYTGLRREEVVQLQWSQFAEYRGIWKLAVVGKGNRYDYIILPQAYLAEIKHYRSVFGITPTLPLEQEKQFVFLRRHVYKPLSAHRMNALLKELFLEAAQLTLDVKLQQRLQQASAHWLRHTTATWMDAQGVKPSVMKKHMRHSKMETTLLYVHEEDELIQHEVDKLTAM